jgi:DNA-binding response OmpR family regulator
MEKMATMTTSARILVVDDDPRIHRLLARYLGREGYSVRTASSGVEMRRLLATEQPDLIILDLRLPGENGLTLAQELRAQSDVAIIILTGKMDTIDKVVGLEMGADDYVTKPFEERELLARIRTVLRRTSCCDISTSSLQGSIARFAGWQLDLTAYTLTSPIGEQVHLTSHEFQLLAALVTRHNRVLTRDEILELVAGRDRTPYDRSVDVLVGKLRGKIGDNPKHPCFIQTIRGVGYRFSAHVELQ